MKHWTRVPTRLRQPRNRRTLQCIVYRMDQGWLDAHRISAAIDHFVVLLIEPTVWLASINALSGSLGLDFDSATFYELTE